MAMSHGGSAVHRSGPTRRTSGPIRSVFGDPFRKPRYSAADLSESESRTRYSAADLSESESRTRYSAADLSESESPIRRPGSAKWERMPWRRFVVILCIWNVIWSACFGLFLERRSKPIGVLSADCDRLPIDRCISSWKQYWLILITGSIWKPSIYRVALFIDLTILNNIVY